MNPFFQAANVHRNFQVAAKVHTSLTVMIAKRTGRDGYGKPSYGPDVPWRCEVEEQVQRVKTMNGIEVVHSTVVYVLGNPGVTVDDRVTLPDGSTPPVLGSERYSDLKGTPMEKIVLGNNDAM